MLDIRQKVVLDTFLYCILNRQMHLPKKKIRQDTLRNQPYLHHQQIYLYHMEDNHLLLDQLQYDIDLLYKEHRLDYLPMKMFHQHKVYMPQIQLN